ncbi:hypothetical protein CCR75_006428 [Bremia lactucae]|uniref:Uncharacterized protein n=1 Tax=Bremia lactucae TaxID=4779 RepID=A0A976ID70_BRELC|nr:hypothetical protein CCR75_006428 [Bremia lactucae]
MTKAYPLYFLIHHLLNGAEYDVHGSRLMFYHDRNLDVTAEGLVIEVREIVDRRLNPTSGELELLVDIESSWGPARSIQHDVPVLVARYATKHRMDEL